VTSGAHGEARRAATICIFSATHHVSRTAAASSLSAAPSLPLPLHHRGGASVGRPPPGHVCRWDTLTFAHAQALAAPRRGEYPCWWQLGGHAGRLLGTRFSPPEFYDPFPGGHTVHHLLGPALVMCPPKGFASNTRWDTAMGLIALRPICRPMCPVVAGPPCWCLACAGITHHAPLPH